MTPHIHVAKAIPGYFPEGEVDTVRTNQDALILARNEVARSVQDYYEFAETETDSNYADEARWLGDNLYVLVNWADGYLLDQPDQITDSTLANFDHTKISDHLELLVWQCVETECENELEE